MEPKHASGAIEMDQNTRILVELLRDKAKASKWLQFGAREYMGSSGGWQSQWMFIQVYDR